MLVKYTRTREIVETITISGKDQFEIDQKFDALCWDFEKWTIEDETTVNIDIEELE